MENFARKNCNISNRCKESLFSHKLLNEKYSNKVKITAKRYFEVALSANKIFLLYITFCYHVRNQIRVDYIEILMSENTN